MRRRRSRRRVQVGRHLGIVRRRWSSRLSESLTQEVCGKESHRETRFTPTRQSQDIVTEFGARVDRTHAQAQNAEKFLAP